MPVQTTAGVNVDDGHITDADYKRFTAAYLKAVQAYQAQLVKANERAAERYRRQHADEVA